MAFGQPAGPPASHTQIRHLLSLVEGAGHADLRDARGPLRLTQRQAGGKFTRAEADALIQQLEAAGLDDEPAEPATPRPMARRTARARATPVRSLQAVEDALLATELERRGWVVIPPPSPTT